MSRDTGAVRVRTSTFAYRSQATMLDQEPFQSIHARLLDGVQVAAACNIRKQKPHFACFATHSDCLLAVKSTTEPCLLWKAGILDLSAVELFGAEAVLLQP